MTEVKEALMIFRPELEGIVQADIKAFTENMLAAAPAVFYQNKETVSHTKRVFKLVNELLNREGTGGPYRDMMLTAVLLSDISENSLPEDLRYIHPLAAAKTIRDLGKDMINGQMLDALAQMIESHEGPSSPSKRMEPPMGTPGFVIALANQIVRFEFISIEV